MQYSYEFQFGALRPRDARSAYIIPWQWRRSWFISAGAMPGLARCVPPAHPQSA